MDEFGICNHCESPMSLEQIRSNRCYGCNEDVKAWEVEFMGDVHNADAERKVFKWTDFSRK